MNLTTEQLTALQVFAARNGRTWKSVLANAWFDGNYRKAFACDISMELQQVRNSLGPRWLTTFKLPR